MHLKHILQILLVLTISTTLSTGFLPPSNFGHFGLCTIQFVRLSNTSEYVDLTEHLVHANTPTNLVTIYYRPNFFHPALHEEKMVLDFKFYEACTITVFVKFGREDNAFRVNYLDYTREGHRTRAHSVLILISTQPPGKIFIPYFYDFGIPNTIFALHVKTNVAQECLESADIEWFLICLPCKNLFHLVDYTEKVKTLSLRRLQADWHPDVHISAYTGSQFYRGSSCGNGRYYIALRREECTSDERKYLTIAALVNVTFVSVRHTEMENNKWGFYYLAYSLARYDYHTIDKLYSFQYEGYHALYCDFEVWSENSELAVWVSPFARNVWLSSFTIVLIVVIARILKNTVSFQRSKISLDFDLLKSLGVLLFYMCAAFLRQASITKDFSRWIVVCLHFTCFMLLAQYELYLTANLVAPPRHKIIRTLDEFFAKGYTLVYQTEEFDGFTSVRTRLEEEFVRKYKEDFPRNKTIITR